MIGIKCFLWCRIWGFNIIYRWIFRFQYSKCRFYCSQFYLTAQSVDSFRFEILRENINSNEHTVIQIILLSFLIKFSHRYLSIKRLWSYLQKYTYGEHILQGLDNIKEIKIKRTVMQSLTNKMHLEWGELEIVQHRTKQQKLIQWLFEITVSKPRCSVRWEDINYGYR